MTPIQFLNSPDAIVAAGRAVALAGAYVIVLAIGYGLGLRARRGRR